MPHDRTQPELSTRPVVVGADPESDAITTVEVAHLLGVSPITLRSWDEQYGFPRSVAGHDGRRRYARSEVLAFSAALRHTHSVPLAIDAAQRRPAEP